jgi:hypothetical protein
MPDAKPIRLTGTLVRLRDEGYCFIHVRGGVEHYCNINSMRHRAEWVEGQNVSFVPGKAPEGKAPPAYDVVAVLKDPRPVFMT